MERMADLRLKCYLEGENLIPQQAGFRQHYSTEGQVTLLSREIEDEFHDKNIILAARTDLRRAFDKVWKQ